MNKIIVAEYRADTYSLSEGIPWVTLSNHPRFVPGTRLDYGFLRVALAQGYNVLLLTTGYPMTETEKEIFGEAKEVKIGCAKENPAS